MNGWYIALIVYGAGWLITLVGIVWSLRNDEVSPSEPGDDEAAILFLLFVWPFTWCLYTFEVIADRRDKQRQNS